MAFDSAAPNNLFGIHLAVPDDQDIQDAARLVNSTNGKWGYVTVVIQENDRSVEKWQQVFDNLRELKLIPIVRLATQPSGSSWRRPEEKDADEWVKFLNSLNWVVRDRYVILFNEPNHGNEWGGAVDPESYANVSLTFAKKLKERNANYFIMLAGIDASAPSNRPINEDLEIFVNQILATTPNIFDHIDGWSSHSYSNPGFSGTPYDNGRGTIRSYEWELNMLGRLGITKPLPVFITETGWKRSGSITELIQAEYQKTAYDLWRDDKRVRAATPFILNYQGDPFLEFSWKKKDSQDFYSVYEEVQKIVKIMGEPEQYEDGIIVMNVPQELAVNSTYRLEIPIENTGQAIWSTQDGYEMKLKNADLFQSHFFANLDLVRPFHKGVSELYVKTGSKQVKSNITVGLYKGERELFTQSWQVGLVAQPSLTFQVNLFPRLRPKQEREFEIQIFDPQEQLVFKQYGLKRINGKGTVKDVKNVYVGGRYRVVILSKYYLPRQVYVTIKKGDNIAQFKSMLPLDPNFDGKFDLGDVVSFIRDPRLLGLFLP